MSKLLQPIIFIGSGRSGTTIISEIIFRHEDLAWPSTYQEKFPSILEVNVIRNFFDNSFWRILGQKPQLNKVSRVNKLLFKPAEAYQFWERITGDRIDFSRDFLLEEKATEEEKRKILSAFHKMVLYQKRKRLAFKITGPARIGYLSGIFPDAVYVNIVREPLPTIRSWLNVDFWQDKGKNKLWWTGAYSKDEINWAKSNFKNPSLLAALQYKKLNDTTASEIKKHNVQCLTVKYEHFVNDPGNCIHEILSFTGLKPGRAIADFMEQNKIFNQNKKEADFFSEDEIVQMQKILNGEYAFA